MGKQKIKSFITKGGCHYFIKKIPTGQYQVINKCNGGEYVASLHKNEKGARSRFNLLLRKSPVIKKIY